MIPVSIQERGSVVCGGNSEITARVALIGAFMLFVDFANLFRFSVSIQERSRW